MPPNASIDSRNRLIFAMDVAEPAQARELAEALGDSVRFYKLGLEMMMSGGYFELVDWMVARGKKVFADLKFFDVPATVGAAVRQLSRRGVTFATVHGNQGIMEAAAKDKGLKRVMPLNVAGAYHSRLMEPARAEFAAFLEGVAFHRPAFTVFTNTTGQAVSEPADIRAALVKQVVSSVLWEDCMRSAVAAGATEFWECGPGGVLAGLARRTEKAWVVKSFNELSELPA